MAVTLPADVLRRYRRVTRYNSPFAAHDRGRAVDLYPGDPTAPDPLDDDPVPAPSPVGGEVIETRTVAAPSRPYAAEHDHLLLIDTGEHVARILHVDPDVSAGDRVAVGDTLGTLVRAGFFAPWVANHLHLGFREHGANHHRAAGSLPLAFDPAFDVEPLAWDGTGTVVAAGETYAVLDAPAHPDPGESFAGLAATDAAGRVLGTLDGGLPHYDGGGLFGVGADQQGDADRTDVYLTGDRVGRADGRDVTWDDLTVLANGDPITGIALAADRERAGARLVDESLSLPVGTEVTVEIRSAESDVTRNRGR